MLNEGGFCTESDIFSAPGGDALWLVYKAKAPDRIFAQEVTVVPADLSPVSVVGTGTPPRFRLQPAGPAVQLIAADQPWENKCVEAPWVVVDAPQRSASSRTYMYLFYAADWDKKSKPPDHKAIGVARSKSGLLGPWEKRPLPILHSSPNYTAATLADTAWRISPGHCSVIPSGPANGSWAIVYHSSLISDGGTVPGPREMMMDSLVWGEDGWPSVDGGTGVPSQTPRTAPQAAVAGR